MLEMAVAETVTVQTEKTRNIVTEAQADNEAPSVKRHSGRRCVRIP